MRRDEELGIVKLHGKKYRVFKFSDEVTQDFGLPWASDVLKEPDYIEILPPGDTPLGGEDTFYLIYFNGKPAIILDKRSVEGEAARCISALEEELRDGNNTAIWIFKRLVYGDLHDDDIFLLVPADRRPSED